MNWFTLRFRHLRSWLNYCWLSFLGVQSHIDRLESKVRELEGLVEDVADDLGKLEGEIDNKADSTDLDQLEMDKVDADEFNSLQSRVEELEGLIE